MTPIEVLRAIRDGRHFDRTSGDMPWWMFRMMSLDDIVRYAYIPILPEENMWRKALMAVLDEPETISIDVTKALSSLKPNGPTIHLLKHPKTRIGWSLWTVMGENVKDCCLDLLALIPASRVILPTHYWSMNTNFLASNYVLVIDILAHVVQWPIPVDEHIAHRRLVEAIIQSRLTGPSTGAVQRRYYPARVRQHLPHELVRYVTVVNNRLDLIGGCAGPR